jgi:hypothetical protein
VIEIEKFIPSSYADTLENLICKNPEFHWTYCPSTNRQSAPHIMQADARSYESDQLVHAFFLEGAQKSGFFDMIFPFFYFLEDKTGIVVATIERIKANMLLRKDSSGDSYNAPHVDIPEPHWKSMLYFVTDSDGDTVIFNETFESESKKGLTIRKRIAPTKGRAVVFDSNTWHASSNPRMHSNRIVLNFVFAPAAPQASASRGSAPQASASGGSAPHASASGA